MNKRWLKLAAVPITLSFVAAACGSDDDGDAGSSEDTTAATEAPAEGGDASKATEITVTGPERDESEVGGIQAGLDVWGAENGVEVTYIGDADWEANVNTQVEGGNPPDISFFPQPGKLAGFARDGVLKPLNDDAAAATAANWPDAWNAFGNVDGVQYGVPGSANLKSLVWYQPDKFEEAGYTVPTTFDEFTALVDQITADGGPKALCVGIESGQATGWTYTDWVEDMVLRQHGPDVYDQWVDHEIPFNDPRIVELDGHRPRNLR